MVESNEVSQERKQHRLELNDLGVETRPDESCVTRWFVYIFADSMTCFQISGVRFSDKLLVFPLSIAQREQHLFKMLKS